MAYWKQGHKIQNGRYTIDRILGTGGAGVTYRVIDQLSGQLVALKTLNAEMQAQPEFPKHQERFIQEAFRLAKCTHPHIIRVNDVFQEKQLWCIAMEYIAGGTLSEYVQKKGILSESEALNLIRQVGSALDYVHQQGFLHRDVKPGNIMIRAINLEAVLIDFGLAREFKQDKIQIHTNSRTESFAPIEQYEMRAKRGAYTDVYALAATLYFLLTLQLPFPAPFRQQGANIVAPKRYNPNLRESINQAILIGMELEPKNRPQSIQAWLNLLERPSIPSQPSQPSGSLKRPEILASDFEDAPTLAGSISPPAPLLPAPPPPVREPATFSETSLFEVYNSLKQSNVPMSLPQTSNVKLSLPEIPEQVPLLSEMGISYRLLESLLKAGKWKEADQETSKIVLRASEREQAGWLDLFHVRYFPCQDLQTLDLLWMKFSNSRFGFSVQGKIYEKLGGTDTFDPEVWRNFGDKVGWRKGNNWLAYKDLTFQSWACDGHLPMLGMHIWGFKGWIGVIAKRLRDCEKIN